MIARLLITIVKSYQITISPVFGGACRFTPSCSEYAIEAFRTHGALKGSRLAAGRLFRCHPFRAAGYDPVPRADDRGHHRAG